MYFKLKMDLDVDFGIDGTEKVKFRED